MTENPSTESDKELADKYLNFARLYESKNPEMSIKYYKKAIELFKDLDIGEDEKLGKIEFAEIHLKNLKK